MTQTAPGSKIIASLMWKDLFQEKKHLITTKIMQTRNLEKHPKLNDDSINDYAIPRKSKIIKATGKAEDSKASVYENPMKKPKMKVRYS